MPLRPPPPPPRDPLIGRRLGGKYIVRALIGRGGFGAVYRADQAAVSRAVAIKVIHPDRSGSSELRRRFVLEANAIAAVSHPCVVSLFDHGVEPDGLMYMALEYVDGRPLSDVIVGDGPLTPSRAVNLVRQVVAGVAEAHRFGVVHRDLKPANIMIARDAVGVERVKVLDFGIAKLFADPSVEATREGLMLGTPKYASPEQIRARGVGPWSDQYGIGAVLFHLLAGHAPFTAPSVPEVLAMHLREPAPRLGAHIPHDLATLVERCMAKRPVDRFPDLPALARALDRAANRLAPWLPATERMRLEDPTMREPVRPAPPAAPPPQPATPPLAAPAPAVESGREHPSMMAGAVEHDPVAAEAASRRSPWRAGLGFALAGCALWMAGQAMPGDAGSHEPNRSGQRSAASAVAASALDPGPDEGVRAAVPPPTIDAETYATLDLLPPDAAPPDAAPPDAAQPDAAPPDAALPDAALPDAAPPDAVFPAAPAPVATRATASRRATPRAHVPRTRPPPDPEDQPDPIPTPKPDDPPGLRLDWLDNPEAP